MNTSLRLTIALSLLNTVFSSVALAQDSTDQAGQIDVLQSQTSPREKDAACVWLKRHGTAKAVPALAALLNDDELSQSARYALESIPGPKAENALIAALEQTSGSLKAGVIHSLGIRCDARAVPELAKLLADANGEIASVSAASLGDIATPNALKALEDQLNAASPATRSAVVDGCLRCGGNLLAAGDREHALAVFQKLYRRPDKEFVHVAAWRGMVLASGTHALELMANAITNGPAPFQMEAIQMAHEVKIPGATKVLVDLLPTVDALTQVALIDALAQRDDPVGAPAIATLAQQGAPDVRVAAFGALGSLGSDKDVPLLIDIAATAGDPARAAARQALTLVHRGNGNQALLSLLSRSKPVAQVEIIRALNSRTAVKAVPQLFYLARQSDDPVREAAFQALGRLVNQSQLETLAQEVGQVPNETGRSEAAEALSAACRHLEREQGTVDMTPVWAVLKNGAPATRVSLMPVCSSLASPQAREILRTSIADVDSDVRAAALHAMDDTLDAELLPDLQKVACESPDEDARTLAMESCVRLTTQEEGVRIPDADRIKVFQAIIPAATTPSQKRVVLSGLASLSSDDSLKLAQPLMSDVTVSNEAARAVIQICRELPDAQAAASALENLSAQATNDEIRQAVQGALRAVDARAEYITAWQFAGPYQQKGQNFSALFDIVFPPETANAQGVKWRALPVSDDPDNSWVMDLLKPMGGEQEVAYARTSIHCDSEQPAWFLVNSDDGVKVWLNGAVVHANNTSRGLNGPADQVKITFKPGWNDVLLKITQNNAGWGFWVRLTDTNGGRLMDVHCATGSTHSQM
ncbi:MAG: HEAT repeat domain-containing protein [Verrucomicrobiota bacterium]